jgi:hypothetical protein
MRVKRVVAGLTAVTTAFVGLMTALAGPAAAVEVGVWRAYGNTNPITSSPSTWGCGESVRVAADVVAQVCTVRSSSGTSVQGAVIVRNNGSSLFSATAWMDVYADGLGFSGSWQCPRSGVGAKSWSVCFGRSLYHRNWTITYGSVNDVHLGGSQQI